jgi:hypothetical protein
MLVEDVATFARRLDDTEGFVTLVVTGPRRERRLSTPREFLSTFAVMTAPKRAVPFVETDDAFDTFEGPPRLPRRALSQFVTQRRAIEGVRRRRVRVERARVEYVGPTLWSRAHEHVVVQMGLAVSVQSMREAHDTPPGGGLLVVNATLTFAHDERSFLQVRHRRAHRDAMRFHDAARVIGINREQDGDRSRRGDDDVVTSNTRTLARHQYPPNVGRVCRVAASA